MILTCYKYESQSSVTFIYVFECKRSDGCLYLVETCLELKIPSLTKNKTCPFSQNSALGMGTVENF